jgi:hypothetical protein
MNPDMEPPRVGVLPQKEPRQETSVPGTESKKEKRGKMVYDDKITEGM